MTGFNTSQEAMAAGAAHVNEATQQVQTHINTLRNEVHTMLGGWGGNAAGAFANLHTNFEGQATKINASLDAMHDALVSSRATYAAQEEQETAAIASMSSQINEM